MARVLEAPGARPLFVEYDLSTPHLPFALTFARRHALADCPPPSAQTTQSDGKTTSNDGSEEFDWLDDD